MSFSISLRSHRASGMALAVKALSTFLNHAQNKAVAACTSPSTVASKIAIRWAWLLLRVRVLRVGPTQTASSSSFLKSRQTRSSILKDVGIGGAIRERTTVPGRSTNRGHLGNGGAPCRATGGNGGQVDYVHRLTRHPLMSEEWPIWSHRRGFRWPTNYLVVSARAVRKQRHDVHDHRYVGSWHLADGLALRCNVS